MLNDYYDRLTFELTEDHLTLLRRSVVRWEDVEYGAAAIDPKRPYGSSSGIEEQIAEILDWDVFTDHEEVAHLTKVQYDRARELHEETLIALQVALRTGTFQVGTYVRGDSYTLDWELTP